MRLIRKLLGVDKPITTTEASDEDFMELIGSRRIVLVDFWATWCAPCQRFAPIFEKVATMSRHLDDVRFVAVDIDTCPEAAKSLQIQSVPTVVAFVDGSPVHRGGAMNESALLDFVQKLRGLAGIV